MMSARSGEGSQLHTDRREFWAVDWLLLGVALLPINLLPSLAILLAGIGMGLYRRAWRQQDSLHLVVGFLVLWMVMGIPFALDWQQSLLGAANHLPFLLFFLIASSRLSSPHLREQVATLIVMGSLFVSVLGLGQALWGWQIRIHLGSWTILKVIEWPRPTSIFPSHNILAVYLVLSLALAAGLFLSGKARSLVIAAYGLGVPLLVLTASRNGWGIACLGVLIGLLLYRQWLWVSVVVGLCCLSLGAALGIPGLRAIVPSLIWERLAATIDPTSSFFSSTLNRIDAWEFALQMVRERPWLGWGWQSFPLRYNTQIPAPDEFLHHCHNLYLTLAAEGGLPILIGFLVLWIWVLARGWRTWIGTKQTMLQVDGTGQDLGSPYKEAPLVLSYILASTCYFVSGFLDAVFFDGRINVVIWVLLAAVNGAWWHYTDRSTLV